MEKHLSRYIEQSAEKITKQYFEADVVSKGVREEPMLTINQEVIVAMNITGAVDGLVLVGMKQKDAMFLAKKVMELQGFDDLEGWDEFAQSAILEYVNEVMGNVTELLSDDKIIADITIPKLASKEMYNGVKKQIRAFELDIEKENRIIELEYKIYQP